VKSDRLYPVRTTGIPVEPKCPLILLNNRDNNYPRLEPMTNHTLQKLNEELTIEQIETEVNNMTTNEIEQV